jgi:CheY-like chemotaxis protein
MTRVLLVEDDDNERFTLTRVLERAGFEVTALAHGNNALEALASSPHDAVVTDLMMPGVDGLSLVRRIAEHYPHLPLVLTSAYPMCRGQLDRLDITGMHFLCKPLDIDRLLALLGSKRVTTSVVPAAPAGSSAGRITA